MSKYCPSPKKTQPTNQPHFHCNFEEWASFHIQRFIFCFITNLTLSSKSERWDWTGKSSLWKNWRHWKSLLFKALGCKIYRFSDLTSASKHTQPHTSDLKTRLNVFVKESTVLILIVSYGEKKGMSPEWLLCPLLKRRLEAKEKCKRDAPYTDILRYIQQIQEHSYSFGNKAEYFSPDQGQVLRICRVPHLICTVKD